MKIRHSYDYTSNSLTAKIHWVEVYFLPQDNDTVQRLSARELGQMTSSIAKACMSALSPHLMVLIRLNMLRIGLRVNLASDFVSEIDIMIIFWLFLSFSKFFPLAVNPLSAKITKWSNTFKQFVGKLPTNCLSVFDHFVGMLNSSRT